MKEIFRKLVYCSFLSIVSIGCFDAEARLPKYMAQSAVEKLVETAWPEGDRTFVDEHYTIQHFIQDIIDIIYTNEGRQSLATWMHERRPVIKDGKKAYGGELNVLDHVTLDTPLHKLLSKLLAGSTTNTPAFNKSLSMLMNLAFPCWTGTLTCYMHNPRESLAKESLQIGADPKDIVVNACKWLLLQDELPMKLKTILNKDKVAAKDQISTQNANLVKLIGVLFTLEVIDDWNQLKSIVAQDDLDEPEAPDGYPAALVVPIPNTGYYNSYYRKYESDCHLSTLKNLLAILCINNYRAIKDENTSLYFPDPTKVAGSIEVVMGATSKQNHTKWFDALPDNIKNSAEPSIYWLIYALKVLLGGYTDDFSTFQLELLQAHEDEIGALQKTIHGISIDTDNAEVAIERLQGEKIKPWRDHRMTITIPKWHIIIQIDGTLAKGSHIEITDIRRVN